MIDPSMKNLPKTILLPILLILFGIFPGSIAAAQQIVEALPLTARGPLPGLQPNSRILLPNGWSLAPQGAQVPLGDFPTTIQLSADGKFVAALHCGYGEHEIRVVSLSDNSVVSSARIDQGFYGLAFSDDGSQLIASGGEDEQVYVFPFAEGYLAKPVRMTVASDKEQFVVSGVAPISAGNELAVCGLLANELRVLSLESGTARLKISLGDESFPYAICLDSDKKIAYVSLWGKSAVAVVDLASGKLSTLLPTLSHPTEMVLLDEGRTLLVACSDSNSVVVIDTQTARQREVIRTSLFPKAPNGSTPSSLAVSPDGKVLVVANSDNNNLALFDISERGSSFSLGFIPVGWYPTSVRFSSAGDRILVANGKGMTSRSNVHGANPNLKSPATVREYIGGLFRGTLSIIPTPSPAEMARMTRLAMECSPLDEAQSTRATDIPAGFPVPAKVGQPSPIKRCIYIIKENRTYDQVFGDLPVGNGDPSLCIFPEKITPNHHALARQFVVLDNFYVESEVSADGHEWSMAAYATDFVEKTWPLDYRGGHDKLTYPAEGKFKIAQPSSGYIWDRCLEANVSYFSFGEFVENGETPDDPCTTNIESLKGHFDPQFRSYDLDYPDVKRAERFIQRWQQFEQDGNTPQLTILRLPNDHTYGTRVGKPTPTAMVADNDVALGMVVEAVSKSKAWKETAIFVVEDDAQNGSDHVDAPSNRGPGNQSVHAEHRT